MFFQWGGGLILKTKIGLTPQINPRLDILSHLNKMDTVGKKSEVATYIKQNHT